jgi:hypothetical protein
MSLTPAEDVDLRIEVLNREGQVIDEIDVDECKVRHDAKADVHRSVQLATTSRLEWQTQRVKPWVRVTSPALGLTEEVPMGVFVLTHPTPDDSNPPTFTVTGYDLLYLLDQKLIEPVTQPTGQPVILSAKQVLGSYGQIQDRIDPSRASDVLSEPKVWPVEFDGTALDVANDFMSMIAYDELYMSDEGEAHSSPIIPLDQRPTKWRYDAQFSTLVDDEGRSLDEDYTDAPNYWVFWSANVVRDDPPVVNDGLYIVRNEIIGPASISARGGTIVRSDNDGPIESITQDDLVANGNRIVQEELYAVTAYAWSTDVNPYHGHNDVLEIIDRDYGFASRCHHVSWEMDVLGRKMDHVAHAILGGVP